MVFGPGVKPTHVPAPGGACQGDTGKGKGVKVKTHQSHTAATSLWSRQCIIKMMNAQVAVIIIQSRCHGVSRGKQRATPRVTIDLEASSQIASSTGYICQDFPVENLLKGGGPWPQPGPKTQRSKAHAVRQPSWTRTSTFSLYMN